MIRILFVCLGNICRSPLAQGVFEDKIQKAGLNESFYIDSAGTSNWHQGEKPDQGSILIARKNHIKIDHQKSRPVTSGDNHEFDYFIAMDSMNVQTLLEEYGIPSDKIFRMRDFDPQPGNGNVPDPYGGGRDNFEQVFTILERSMDPFVDFLKQKHNL